MSELLICRTCGQSKPEADYYRWTSNHKFMKDCKKCHTAKNRRVPLPLSTCGIEHQNTFIQILQEVGVYAAPGKRTQFPHADIVVWGCVRIEVKLGESIDKYNPYMWKFRFTRRQVAGGLVADLVCLMCPDGIGKGYTCYLINPDCSEFYRDGKRKAALTINLGTHRKNRRDGKRSLSHELLSTHRNNWYIIEQKRLEVAAAYQTKALALA